VPQSILLDKFRRIVYRMVDECERRAKLANKGIGEFAIGTLTSPVVSNCIGKLTVGTRERGSPRSGSRTRKAGRDTEKQIADLERQLAGRKKNSTNSSKPPSSDGLAGDQRPRGRSTRASGSRVPAWARGPSSTTGSGGGGEHIEVLLRSNADTAGKSAANSRRVTMEGEPRRIR